MRKMQTQTIVEYYPTLTRTVVILKKRKIKSGDRNVETLERLYVTGGNVKWFSHCEKVRLFLIKLNIGLACEQLPSLVYISKRIENRCLNKFLYMHVHSSMVHNNQR